MKADGKNYEEMTLEELQREAWEALLDTDRIDGPLTAELEKLREALSRKRPVEYLYTPEESWERFLENHAEELEPFLRREAESEGEKPKERRGRTGTRSVPALLRRVLIAAAVIVLLAGAVLAADSLGLWAWAPRWNPAAGRFEPAAADAQERPIPAALRELGITEPVYPARLPKGFVLTESHISEDPLLLVEQYARGNERLSITVAPVKGMKSTVYTAGGAEPWAYQTGKTVHYMFKNEETIIAVRYTRHYATTISGNLALGEIEAVIDSLYAASEGGSLT